MSKYTMEIRELVSTFGRSEVKNWFSDYELNDFLSPEEIDAINEKGVWNKDKLAERIIDHFYTREIGTDAIGQFILFAKDKMNELMETYLPLIYSASLKYNPLDSADYTETYSSKSTSKSEDQTDNTTSSNGSGLTVSSETPQGQISKAAILAGNYASSTAANENTNSVNGNTNSSSNGEGTEDYSKRIKGNINTSAIKMIEEYRKNIRAIDTEIIYALEPLFMGIY